MNQPVRMNLQWSSPTPCIRTRRVTHKRLDSDDQPPAKCARLSADVADAQGFLSTSPGSPVSPISHPIPATHVGPSRIGPFLLLPLADRESVHSAMNTDTGDELLCKVCAIARHCAIPLNEWCFKTPRCSTVSLACRQYLADFFTHCHSHANCGTFCATTAVLLLDLRLGQNTRRLYQNCKQF